MATLTIAAGGEQQTFPITGTVAIGRAIDNDIQLDSVNVSRHHASIISSPDGFLLMDLGSANGSRINGKEVEPRVPVAIRPGDRITLADVEIGLQDGVAAPSAAVAEAGPGTTRVGGAQSARSGPHATVFAAVAPRLEIVTRTGTREVPLTGDRITLGRESDNAIQLDADVVSRHHLVLR
ncbi:MAG: FHA domain-containing protein, partial [Dehalococcoidia bacterium]|nr:FHA domain-containing protein [Dehalococcoidia bacterium]